MPEFAFVWPVTVIPLALIGKNKEPVAQGTAFNADAPLNHFHSVTIYEYINDGVL